jgi:small conductance mechanosensitive channel
MENILGWLSTQGLQFGLQLGAALAILLGGWLLALVAVRLVKRLMAISRFEVPRILGQFVEKLVRVTVWLFAGIMALGQLGVNIGPLIAGLGATGFILGFAMQQTLANFAAGFMILLYRPYDIGHSIEVGGTKGKVEEINLTITVMRTGDNAKLIVPNGKIWGNIIRNNSDRKTRRLDLVVGISYDAEIAKAKEIIMDILEKNDKVLSEPAPSVRVDGLGDSAVNLIVRPWCRSSDFGTLKDELIAEIKEGLEQAGIAIPYPQLDVHVVSQS